MPRRPPSLPRPRHHAGWRGRLRRMLVAGILILIPVAVTVFILVQIFRFMDGIFAPGFTVCGSRIQPAKYSKLTG